MRFDDAILVVAKIRTLRINVNQEEAHTATLEGQTEQTPAIIEDTKEQEDEPIATRT